MHKLIIFSTLLFFTAACSKGKNEIVQPEEEIDMSEIDFSNIENLFAQPLPVIQKCLEGNWKLIYTYGGISGEVNIAANGDYMNLTTEQIIMGNNTCGI